MAFDIPVWRDRIAQRLVGWKGRWEHARTAGISSLYAFLSAMALWPVVEAAQQGEVAAGWALGSVAAGVGGNLLANQIQSWNDEADATQQLDQLMEVSEEVRAALDAVLEQLDVIAKAQDNLDETDRAWFVESLQGELARLGNLGCHEAVLVDSGAIARGSGAAAAGKEGVAVAGYIVGDVLGPGARKKVHYCAPGAISPDCIRIAYLKRLIHECGMLPLLGLGTSVGHAGANQVGDMPLWTTYIHPDTTQQPVTQMPSPQQKMDHPKCREAVERRQACTALEAVARFPYLVVTGKPGAGQSTFATHLIRCLAAHNLPPEESPFAFDLSKHLPGLTLDPGLLPVRVTLRGFARDLPSDAHKGTAHLLWQYILRSLAPLDEFGGSLKDALLRGRALVVLDGLDEVPETSREGKVSPRRLVLQAVEDFALCNFDSRNARYLVTCRTASYIPPWTLDGFKEAELAEFDLEKQDHFCQLWYTELARRGQLDESEVEEKVAGLRRAIRRPDLERISGNPLLLTVMALVHAREPELPEARALLYEKCVDVLLWLWERRKEDEGCPADLSTLLQEAGVARTSFARVLGRLAYDVHMRVHVYERKNS